MLGFTCFMLVGVTDVSPTGFVCFRRELPTVPQMAAAIQRIHLNHQDAVSVRVLSVSPCVLNYALSHRPPVGAIVKYFAISRAIGTATKASWSATDWVAIGLCPTGPGPMVC